MDSLAYLKGKGESAIDVESCCAMMKECCWQVFKKIGREAYMLEGARRYGWKTASNTFLKSTCDGPFSFFTLLSFVRITYSSSDEYVSNVALSPLENFPIQNNESF